VVGVAVTAQRASEGAVRLDGRMIDKSNVERARQLRRDMP